MAESINPPEKFIIDASFVLSKLLPDEKLLEKNKEYFNSFRDGKIFFVAPLLLKYEVINGLKNAFLQKRLTLQKAEKILREFLLWPIQYKDVDANLVLGLSIINSLTAYDASYLYLAKSNGWQLLTLDKKLSSL